MGFVRDFTGLALALGYPAVPGVAHTNPVRDKTGLANWVGALSLLYNILI